MSGRSRSVRQHIGARRVRPRPSVRCRIAQITAPAADRVTDLRKDGGPVGDAMRDGQQHSRRAIRERLQRKAPGWALFGIERQIHLFVGEFRTSRTAARGRSATPKSRWGPARKPTDAGQTATGTLDSPPISP